jgi:4-hydroxybenzoate polyprenyltransferase
MQNRWNVVRLDYLFSVVLPCIIALYVNHLPLLGSIRTILGWALLGITGNVINDAIDRDRDLGWQRKELVAIAVGSLALAGLCFIPAIVADPLNGAWIAIAIVLIIVYNFGMKKVPVASALVQVFAEIVMPYFTIHLPTTAVEWLWLVTLYAYGILSQFMHEALDSEAVASYGPKKVRFIVFLFSLIVLVLGVVLFVLTVDINILPFAFVPFAAMYIYRTPRSKDAAGNIKDVGIILGNLFLVYFIVLVVA